MPLATRASHLNIPIANVVLDGTHTGLLLRGLICLVNRTPYLQYGIYRVHFYEYGLCIIILLCIP